MSAAENVSAFGDRIRELLALIAKLREMFPAISLADLLAIFQAAMKLLPLPDLSDEVGCRQWCGRLVGVLDEIADLTTITIDDSIVDALTQFVEDDAMWGVLWNLVEWIVGGKVGAPPSDALAAAWNIDFAKLAALIQALVDFINSWKQ